MAKKNDIFEPYKPVANFGPEKNRHCTDCCCLLLLLAASAAMHAIGLAAVGAYESAYINRGNPDRLLRGVDYKGNICGVDSEVKHLGKKWEPNSIYVNPDSNGDFVPSELGICVPECPDEGESYGDPYGKYGEWESWTKTTDILNYCIPIDTEVTERIAQDSFGDFIRAAGVIGVTGFAVSAGLSYLFMYTIRIPCLLRLTIWASIWIVQIILVAGSYVLVSKADALDDAESDSASTESKTQILMLRGLGGALGGLAVIWLCLICVLRERIALAISLIKEAARAITDLVLLPLFCVFQAIMICAFSTLWLLYACFLASSAEVETHTENGNSYKTFEYSDDSKRAVLFMVFAWFWTVYFIIAMGQLITAHSVLTWYFCDNDHKVGIAQIFRSTWIGFRYHSGTVALGSCIIAVLGTLRAFLYYVKHRTAGSKNFLAKFVICVLGCLLYCFEKCIKYINKNAYIQCAMHGTPFFTSARRAFGLILRNLARVAVVSVISDFVIFIGKVAVMLVCCGLAYYYMEELTGYFLPLVFTAFVSYNTASVFLDSISVTTDTLLQGYIIEEEMGRCADDGDASAPSTRPKLRAAPSFVSLMDEQKNKRKDLIERQQLEMTQNNGNSI